MLAIVALHLVLIVFATALFLQCVEDGPVGSYWAAVARVPGPVIDGWLAVASTEIGKGMNNAGQKDVLVGSVWLVNRCSFGRGCRIRGLRIE